jgi:hypothetical protein
MKILPASPILVPRVLNLAPDPRCLNSIALHFQSGPCFAAIAVR